MAKSNKLKAKVVKMAKSNKLKAKVVKVAKAKLAEKPKKPTGGTQRLTSFSNFDFCFKHSWGP